MRPIRFAATLAAVCITAVLTRPSHAGDLNAYASCSGPGQVAIAWQFYEFDGGPAGHPEWVGYDFMRRSIADCGDWTRLNADIVPRVFGQTHSGTFIDASAGSAVAWEYRVVPVDAARQPVILLSPHCEPPCVPFAWASCPQASAALFVGKAVTFGGPGGMVFLERCAATCYGGFYVTGPLEEAIRAHANTGTVLRIFGTAVCGSVEGCSLEASAFEVSNCSITPAQRATWGSVKQQYR